MIGGGACLLTLGIAEAIRQEGVIGDNLSTTAALMSAIINGAGLLATGIPLAIKGPIALVDAKHYKKKASLQKTSYEIEPAILNIHSSKAVCGLAFRLHF